MHPPQPRLSYSHEGQERVLRGAKLGRPAMVPRVHQVFRQDIGMFNGEPGRLRRSIDVFVFEIFERGAGRESETT